MDKGIRWNHRKLDRTLDITPAVHVTPAVFRSISTTSRSKTRLIGEKPRGSAASGITDAQSTTAGLMFAGDSRGGRTKWTPTQCVFIGLPLRRSDGFFWYNGYGG